MRVVSLRVALTTMLVAGLAFGAARSARADTGSLPGGATIKFNREFLYEVDNPATSGGTVPAQPLKTPDSLWKYFNYAHCQCDTPTNRVRNSSGLSGVSDPDHHETTFGYELLLQNRTTPIHVPMHIYVGSQCDTTDLPTRATNCTEVANVADIDSLYPTGTTPYLHIYDLMTPEAANRGSGTDPVSCQQRALDATEWLSADTTMSGTIDFWQSQVINTDSLPPPVPSVLRASGGESAINLSWDMPNGDIADIYYYQALCADGSGNPAREPAASPLYQTPYSLCGAPETITFTTATPTITARPAPAGSGVDAAVDAAIDAAVDAGTTTIPTGIQQMDGAYICGSTTSATATSLRIDGLTNGTPYQVALLAIDKSGNASGVFLNATITPQAVTDEWEDLHDRGSKVEGGFCLINDTFGNDSGISNGLRAFRDQTLASTAFGRWLTDVYYADVAPLGASVRGSLPLRVVSAGLLAPAIALALGWHYLTLPGLLALLGLCLLAGNRRRVLARRAVRLALAGAGAAVALVGAPHAASAQVDPYWNHPDSAAESDAAESSDAPSVVHWHAGLRVGPYTPQIDAQLGGAQPGPYAQMFGGYTILPMLDVDRVVWRGAGGQFLVGGSLGYMSKSANAFVGTSSPSDPNRARSGDTNSFSLIPIAATVGYRLTYFDDEFGVPVVPYLRGGLAYDVWWITAPDGNFAKVCEGTGVEPNCTQNKARGGSAGLTAAIGLSVRAERIDAGAAATMRDGGIQHAGFYAELSLAKVDGFGSETKLSVGDNTWFAGVDFEF